MRSQFLQHCVQITHSLYKVNSLVRADFISEYKRGNSWRKCHVFNKNQWKGYKAVRRG